MIISEKSTTVRLCSRSLMGVSTDRSDPDNLKMLDTMPFCMCIFKCGKVIYYVPKLELFSTFDLFLNLA